MATYPCPLCPAEFQDFESVDAHIATHKIAEFQVDYIIKRLMGTKEVLIPFELITPSELTLFEEAVVDGDRRVVVIPLR